MKQDWYQCKGKEREKSSCLDHHFKIWGECLKIHSSLVLRRKNILTVNINLFPMFSLTKKLTSLQVWKLHLVLLPLWKKRGLKYTEKLTFSECALEVSSLTSHCVIRRFVYFLRISGEHRETLLAQQTRLKTASSCQTVDASFCTSCEAQTSKKTNNP